MRVEAQAHDVVVTLTEGKLAIRFTGWAELSELWIDEGNEASPLEHWVVTGDEIGPTGAGLGLASPAAPGQPGLRLHVPRTGGAVFLTPLAVGPSHLRRLRVRGRLDLGDLTGATWLHEGYQSWDYAGVHPLPEAPREEADGLDAHRSFWRALVTTGHGCLGAAALTAQRFVTAFRARVPGEDGLVLEIEQAGAPSGQPAVFSFRQGRPADLDLPLEEGVVEGETVVLMAGPDPIALAEDLVDVTAFLSKARHWEGESLKGWESWYYYGTTVTADAQLENTRLMRERLAGVGFVQSQIDAGWSQANGDWEVSPEFSERPLGELAQALVATGAVPGIWVAPFMVDRASRLAAEHPDWLVRDRQTGEPLENPSERDRLALDASHPDALTFLHDLGQRLRSWGFRLVKADFLFLGAVEGERALSHVTGTEAMRAGLGALVRGLGPDVFLLGCGLPLLPGVGLVHANRVGGDVGVPNTREPHLGDPKDKVGPPATGVFTYRCTARNVAARASLHRRFYLCDPDVLLLEPFPLGTARAVMTLGALCGGPYFLADNLAHLDAGRWDLAGHPVLTHLAEGPGFRPVDLFARPDPTGDDRFLSHGDAEARVWVQHRFDGTAVALFNWDDGPWEAQVRWEDVGAAPGPGWGVTDLWTGEPLAFDAHGLGHTVPAQDVALIWIGAGRAPS